MSVYLAPLSGLKVMVKVPGSLGTKSCALYWSPKACLPITIGYFHPGTSLGILSITIGSLNTVPLSSFLIVPFGLFHIFFKPNSLTLPSSGVIVAHLIPTLYYLIALAASRVI